jgi:hypothetical protein
MLTADGDVSTMYGMGLIRDPKGVAYAFLDASASPDRAADNIEIADTKRAGGSYSVWEDVAGGRHTAQSSEQPQRGGA